MAHRIPPIIRTKPAWHESDEFKANFKVNLWLGNMASKYFATPDELQDVDWKHISPSLQLAINNITYALRDASSLSDEECKRTQRK